MYPLRDAGGYVMSAAAIVGLFFFLPRTKGPRSSAQA